MAFGNYIRERREELSDGVGVGRHYSLRQVANRVGVEPSYLSKVEREVVAPPSESTIKALAADLEEDSDFLLALADKVSSDVLTIILKRPVFYCALIRRLDNAPLGFIERLVADLD